MESGKSLSETQKQDIQDLFNKTFSKPPINPQSNDIILKEVFKQEDYKKYSTIKNIQQKLGLFYESLFCYLSDFQKPNKKRCDTCKIQKSNHLRHFCETCNRSSFDLINEEEQILY